MKIAAISDIHIREDGSDDKLVEAIHTRVEEISPDVFIIAGDISEKIDHFSEILSHLHVSGCENFYVAGNHDIWFEKDRDLGSLEKYAKSVGAACADNGFIHLPPVQSECGQVRIDRRSIQIAVQIGNFSIDRKII